MLASLIGLLGVIIGFCLDRFYRYFEKKKEYIANAKIVQLMLIKQRQEFEHIKKHFNQFKDDPKRFWHVPSALISETEWMLDKKDLINIVDDGNEEIIKIIFDIIILDKNFKDLLLAIDDHHKYRDPIFQKASKTKTGSININEVEKNELNRLIKAIDKRINEWDFDNTFNKLHSYLKKKFPKEKEGFLKYQIKD